MACLLGAGRLAGRSPAGAFGGGGVFAGAYPPGGPRGAGPAAFLAANAPPPAGRSCGADSCLVKYGDRSCLF